MDHLGREGDGLVTFLWLSGKLEGSPSGSFASYRGSCPSVRKPLLSELQDSTSRPHPKRESPGRGGQLRTLAFVM